MMSRNFIMVLFSSVFLMKVEVERVRTSSRGITWTVTVAVPVVIMVVILEVSREVTVYGTVKFATRKSFIH